MDGLASFDVAYAQLFEHEAGCRRAAAVAARRAGEGPAVEARPIVPARVVSPFLAVVLDAGSLIAPVGAGTGPTVTPLGRVEARTLEEIAERRPSHVRTCFVTKDAVEWLGGLEGCGWLERRGHVSFVLLDRDEAGYAAPWSGCASTGELVDGLRAFALATGACAAASVGQTAERLLLATHPKAKGGRRLDQAPVMPGELELVAEIGSAWRGELGAGRFVHWFDANANYLGAYQSAVLGFGVPARVTVETSPSLADLLAERYPPAGVWRARLPAVDLGDGVPAPWSTTAGAHMTPSIVRAREQLGQDELAELVSEAWVWPESVRFTQPFGERMRDARRALLQAGNTPGAQTALAAVTMAYQRLHGRFGAGFRAGTSSPWARPDWMHTIRAQARVNLDRRIRQLSAAPFAVDVDALYFSTDMADPVEFAGRVGLPLGAREKLGAFRVAGTVELDEARRSVLGEVGSAAATRETLRAWRDGTAPAAVLPETGVLPILGTLASLPADDGLEDLDELAAVLAGGG